MNPETRKILLWTAVAMMSYSIIAGAPFALSRHYGKKEFFYGRKMSIYQEFCAKPKYELKDVCKEFTQENVKKYKELTDMYSKKHEKWDKWAKRLDVLKFYHPKPRRLIAGTQG